MQVFSIHCDYALEITCMPKKPPAIKQNPYMARVLKKLPDDVAFYGLDAQ
jgi:hypothetical protein